MRCILRCAVCSGMNIPVVRNGGRIAGGANDEKPEEIKKGLECCTAPMLAHDSCPYKADRNPFEVICKDRVMEDALALIHQLEAKLAEYEKPLVPLTLEEAKALRGVWIEDDGCCWGDDEPHPAMWDGRVNGHFHQFIDEHYSEEEEHVYFEETEYNKTWRCWPRKPTDEEREAAMWETELPEEDYNAK